MPSSPEDLMPRLLALDTATDTLYLALQAGGRVWTRQSPGGAQASSILLPQVRALLAQAGLALSEVQALAYGRGPGAFTGLRTACSVVQGLALGVDRPVLSLDTLAAVAESARRQGAQGCIWAMQDARMGEVYAAPYEWHDGQWTCCRELALYHPEALADLAGTPGVAWAGSALKVYAPLQRPGVSAWPEAVPDGAALLVLAQAAWQAGQALDASQALPLYVRDKVAQTTAEREALRKAS